MKVLTTLIFLCALVACSNEHATKLNDGNKSTNLPFYNSADFTPVWYSKNKLVENKLHAVQPFSFTDQHGNNFSSANTFQKIIVANFFFTSCPGICKTLTNNLKNVQQEFLKDTTVIIISHSVTPDIDSVSRLNQYASNFHINYNQWKLLTGNKKELYTLARQSYFADEDLGIKKSENDFLHTENIILVDKNKHIRGIYKGTSLLEIKDLINDIHTLESEQ